MSLSQKFLVTPDKVNAAWIVSHDILHPLSDKSKLTFYVLQAVTCCFEGGHFRGSRAFSYNFLDCYRNA